MFHRTYYRFIGAAFVFVLIPWTTLHANSLFAVDPGSTSTPSRIVEFDVGRDSTQFGTPIREFLIPLEALPALGPDVDPAYLLGAGLAHYESRLESTPGSTPESSLFFVNGTDNQLYQFSLPIEAMPTIISTLPIIPGPILLSNDPNDIYSGLAVSDGILYALGVQNTTGFDQIVALDPITRIEPETRPRCSTGLGAIDALAPSLPGFLLTAINQSGAEVTIDSCTLMSVPLPNLGNISGLASDDRSFYVATKGLPDIAVYDREFPNTLPGKIPTTFTPSGLAASRTDSAASN